MKRPLSPHILLVTALAGRMSREQQKMLDYLREENRILKEQFGGRRLRLSDRQRRRLAAKGKRIGRRLLGEFATIVTPDTILRWHRQLIAQKFTNRKGTGRPGVMKESKISLSAWPTTTLAGATEESRECVATSDIESHTTR